MAYSESIIFDDVPGPVSAVAAVVISTPAPKITPVPVLTILNPVRPFTVIAPPEPATATED